MVAAKQPDLLLAGQGLEVVGRAMIELAANPDLEVCRRLEVEFHGKITPRIIAFIILRGDEKLVYYCSMMPSYSRCRIPAKYRSLLKTPPFFAFSTLAAPALYCL